MSVLNVSHKAGFFSCCSFRLFEIINYFNNNKTLPEIVDSSKQYTFFKNNLSDDLTKIIYSDNNMEINYLENVKFSKSEFEYQFSNYGEINFKEVNPFISKYFLTSPIVNQRMEYFIKKYNINLSKTIGVFYRGNDKITETNIGSYETYLNKMYELLTKNPNFTVLIQTDDQDFINFCYGKIPFVCFNELIKIPNNPKHAVHYFIDNKTDFAINFLSVTKIMSMCELLITHSGNCGLWSVLYRGNTNNVSQYLNHNNNGGVWFNN